jgi:diguanylate cyclase (GGDEF)-like protein
VQVERQAMGRMSGALWLLGAAVGAAGQAMPGVPHDHPWVVWGLIALITVYGVACVLEWIPWSRMALRDHLIAILVAQPLIAVGLWASGGVNSYIVPLLVLAMLYSAYFLPGRMAWIGVGALAITNATPLLYTDVGEDQALARIVAFALACEGVTLTLQSMKRKVAAAERAQVEAAGSDALTGLASRASLDRELARAIGGAGAPDADRRVQDPAHVTLLRVAVDDLAGIDARLGSSAGDAVLRELAGLVRPLVRPQDTVARLDADAIAVLAPAAPEPGARRLAQAIRVAAAQLAPAAGEAPVTLSVSWAMFPQDGVTADELLAAATGQHAAPAPATAPIVAPEFGR